METVDSDDDFADWEDDDEVVEVKSFFSDILLSSIQLLLQHDREHFDFDLQNIISASKYDDIGVIMVVNMIRRRVKEKGLDKIESVFISELKTEISKGDFLKDQTNMRPVLNDDQVLFLLRDHLVSTGLLADDDDDETENFVEAKQDIKHSTDEAGMKETLIRYQSLITSLTATSDPLIVDDSYYFDGYSNISIHETMLRDEPRTSAYADALVANSDFIKGKVVLDVGCGTGILCMLAVRAGARKVIGVDCSSIIERTQKVIDRNGMSDKITLIRGRLEEVELPLKNEEVDVIISEWMGYGLYYENMLSSVIYARDTYLSDQGVLMPSTALVYLEAMTATGAVDRVAWWGNVYGFDMTDMADLLSNEAQVQLLDQDDIISNRSLVYNLDIKLASDADLDFIAPFTMAISIDSDIRAFVISFDVIFAGHGFSKEVILSTSVAAEPTHWRQTALWLEPKNCWKVKAGDEIQGTITYKRSESNARDYSVTLNWTVDSQINGIIKSEEKVQKFKLAS